MKRRTVITSEARAVLLELYKSGLSIYQVAARKGVSKSLVHNIVRANGVTPHFIQKRRDGRNPSQHPLYAIWTGMLDRCTNPRATSFHAYGAVGISVCERWRDFWAFAADMGDRPTPGHSVDRIDNSEWYSPDNCRWATAREQQRNRRHNVYLTIGGVTKLIEDWSKETGLWRSTIQARLARGWPPEKAIVPPGTWRAPKENQVG